MVSSHLLFSKYDSDQNELYNVWCRIISHPWSVERLAPLPGKLLVRVSVTDWSQQPTLVDRYEELELLPDPQSSKAVLPLFLHWLLPRQG